jgi:small conductance mechanosensitive channel
MEVQVAADQANEIFLMLKTFIITNGAELAINLVAALAIFILGRWVAKRLKKVARMLMEKAKVDKTLISFATNIVYFSILAFVCIAALGRLGVETASLAAVIAAAGLAIGLALQGSLSNLAAGVMIIVFRPFKTGDFIEAGGTAGVVEEISIFTTNMRTVDNKKIIIPNSSVTEGTIVNYSANATRRIDLVLGVGYDDDLKKVKKVLQKIIDADDRVLKDPECNIAVSELADNSVNFVCRPWVKAEDFWATKCDLTEIIKTTFDKEGISIPYPQRVVHQVTQAAEPAKKAPTKKKKAA